MTGGWGALSQESVRERVLVVEDDETVGNSLARELSADGYDVRVYRDGRAAIDAVPEFAPRAAVIDLLLPHGPDGISVTRIIRRKTDMPILLMSESGDDQLMASFDAGADDFLPKPFHVAELKARIAALLARTRTPPSPAPRVGDITLDARTRIARRGASALALTPTEFELLAAFVEHPNVVLSRLQLAARISNDHARLNSCVEAHLSSLRRKLEKHGPRVVHTKRGAGYVLRPTQPTAATT